ncbi:DNA transfer protein [Salmonella sp. C3257]|uniref:phage DNA ejection protein n=1 Tax=Salmonella TaxID=590 RepID=UPI000F5D084B|nr:phage DNA ejection protein [Salmonella enterica]EBV1848224.1 acyltransferase [Salmonella enterica subsp. enterica serovar Albany]MBJ2437046.1 phage DNA ejection protein [Salmonella enterica subsp. enterica serovar Albany]MBJ2463684.1 phage DNA ejection protein [Salmonella enterica subsp. enterica serovar Albany]MBJ2521360.1 phage DNA ejection protein [Salmonella enterica subsp. enterica serovar Albany]MBJ2525596.1 phage DNA ejection protein [Salmonella enterica subsp. enterica serovar Alban
MATWQGTNGGLLAGIGGVNSNAPSVNDIGNTLQLIRQNNDIERSGANNVGLTALQGLSGIAGVFQQEKQAQRQKEFQQAYANAYASGDRGALRQLATQYPDQIESVRKGMGFIDEDQRNSIGTLAAGARLASSSPEAMQSWLQNNAKELTRVGVDPNNVVQMYQQNPSGFGEFVDHLGMAALGPIDYFNVQDKMAGREIDRGRLAETIRSNQAGEALQARGQDISRANALTSAYAPTAAMQNYNQYAQMLKEDPEGAAAFAAAAGINTNAKKLMSVRENDDGTVTKYYTDGSEEQGKLNQPISGDGFRPIALPTAQKIMEKSPEGAKKAAGFAYRVRDALDSIDTLKDQLSPQRVAIINNALGNGTLANLTLSPTEQQYVVNANDAIMAILRQETGAAIAPAEMSKYYQMYFPQPGDSTKTIDTKRRKMENQFNSLKAASGRAYDALRVISAVDRGTSSSSQTLPQSEQVSQPAASSNFSSLWGD